MALRRLTTSAAMLALVAGLGTGALAQAAPSAKDLPAPLAALNLSNLEVETKRDGIQEVEGRTIDGIDIEARIDMAGNLIEVEADDGALPQSLIDALAPADLSNQPVMGFFGSITEIKQRPNHVAVAGRQPTGTEIEARFDRQNRLIAVETDDSAVPADLVNSLLPQAVRDNDVIGQFDRIDEIVNVDGRVMVKGEDQSGRDMRAKFDADGRVLRFGRDDGPRHDRAEDRRGDRGPGAREGHGLRSGEHEMRGKGPHGEHHRGDGPRAQGPRGNGPMRDGPRGQMPAPANFDAVAVNQRLSDAGYTGFGFLRPDGPRMMLEATNPQGEPVTLEMDPQGEVVRETAR